MDRDTELPALVASLRAQGQLFGDAEQQAAAADIERWHAQGIALLTVGDARYPAPLAVLPSAPPLLFIRGELRSQDCNGVAIVGTRDPSPEGAQDAAHSAQLLSGAGLTIVSGLARGIDTAAHAAALAAPGRTVAVLGNGLTHTYPPENADLQARIATSGALISQFWPEQGPARDSFPTRNALMAALTSATVIVEAHATSGTRIQARHALAYGRRVILFKRVLAQPWAQALAERPGAQVIERPTELTALLASDGESR